MILLPYNTPIEYLTLYVSSTMPCSIYRPYRRILERPFGSSNMMDHTMPRLAANRKDSLLETVPGVDCFLWGTRIPSSSSWDTPLSTMGVFLLTSYDQSYLSKTSGSYVTGTASKFSSV